jgi:type III restriction enzyme
MSPGGYSEDVLVEQPAIALAKLGWETKGLEDLDVPLKMARLRQWCQDINAAQTEVTYDYAYVDEEGFAKYTPHSFRELMETFREYK